MEVRWCMVACHSMVRLHPRPDLEEIREMSSHSSTILGVGNAGDWRSRHEGGSAKCGGGRIRNRRRGTLEGLGSRARRLVWSYGSRRRQRRRR
ncbi:putative extensin-like [Iris pallida]|uniref:Extensin-like n=1 Tax=Iris pallida TaxID=29817 RepID=A0AAX6DQ97_IRIPA|nr:putative extensin-like [Iris pallida]